MKAKPSWTERADNVLALFEQTGYDKNPKKGTPEHTFFDALWHLCQQVKDLDDGGNDRFIPSEPVC